MFLFNESAVCFHKITAIICISAPACLLLYRRAETFRSDRDAKNYRMKEHEILQEIMRDARIGWWQADRKRRMFHISEGLRDLLGLSTCDVSYEEFRDMINPTYREYAFASVGVRGGDFGNEHLYPLRGPKGEIWCYRKLLREETAEDGGMLLTGYFRVTDPPQEANSPEKQQINDLLYRLNSISHTLLSLLKTNDLDVVIDKILTDVQTMFHGGRAYIIYDETELSGMEGCKTTIRVDDRSVRMKRTGLAGFGTELYFEKGKRFSSIYNTPYGPMGIEVLTDDVKNELDLEEGRGSVAVQYQVSLEGIAEGKNRITIDIM